MPRSSPRHRPTPALESRGSQQRRDSREAHGGVSRLARPAPRHSTGNDLPARPQTAGQGTCVGPELVDVQAQPRPRGPSFRLRAAPVLPDAQRPARAVPGHPVTPRPQAARAALLDPYRAQSDEVVPRGVHPGP